MSCATAAAVLAQPNQQPSMTWNLVCPSFHPPQDSVVEPLLPHFLQFYEQDEQMSPPLKLEACARIQVGGPVCAVALEPPPLKRHASMHVRLICGCGQCGGCAGMASITARAWADPFCRVRVCG